MSESIGTISGQPTAVAATCTGQIIYSADNCEVTNVNITCPTPSGQVVTRNGKYEWSTDATHGQGQLFLVLRETTGLLVCQSSYDVVITRL